jgi:hypothetical protein
MTSNNSAEIADRTADTDWTPAERWAWGEIAAGRVADFAALHGWLDPVERKGWGARRTLRGGFLRALLFDQRWTARVPMEGVRIAGARWTEVVALPDARLSWPLALQWCRFERAVDLTGVQSNAPLSLADSVFLGKGDSHALGLDRCALGFADLGGIVTKNGVTAEGARFDGMLNLAETCLDGELWMKRTKATYICMRNVVVTRLSLGNCRIEQDLDLSGALVSDKADMTMVVVGQDLLLGGSETREAAFGDVVCEGASIGGNVNLCGVAVSGMLGMNGIEVEKNLFMRPPIGKERDLQKGESAFSGPVDLSFGVIHGHVELIGTRFAGPVDLSSVQIGGNLHVWSAAFFAEGLNLNTAWVKGEANLSTACFVGDLSAIRARFDGALNLAGTRLRAKLNLADVRIGAHLSLVDEEKARFGCKGALLLTGASIGGQLQLQGHFHDEVTAWRLEAGSVVVQPRKRHGRQVHPIFRKWVDLSNARIKGTLALEQARFDAGLSLLGSIVEENLQLRSAFEVAVAPGEAVTVVDLSAATVTGQLSLNVPQPATGQRGTARIDLRDSSLGSLQVFGPRGGAAWPADGAVLLDGLRYDRLGGYGVDNSDEMANRSPLWFRRWLALDAPYSPQPYEQLSAVLRQAGEIEKANRVLHAGRERARHAAWSWRRPFEHPPGFPRWLGLSLLKITIGYGIGLRFFYALAWAALFTAIGFWMLGPIPVGLAGGPMLTSAAQKIAYSFDQLLPIIELDHSFGDVKLPGPIAAYFWFHRFCGFLLGGFITAGIAGLTQRSRS